MAYGPDQLEELSLSTLAEAVPFLERFPCVWVDIAGHTDDAMRAELSDLFGCHRLSLADLDNLEQRPKAEDFQKNVFVVTRMVEATGPLAFQIEPYYMWVSERLLLSVQPTPHDCLERLRERLRRGEVKLRTRTVDYLLYTVLDSIVQAYFPVLESIGDDLDILEDALIEKPNPTTRNHIHERKRQLLDLRRAIWPQRELLLALAREDLDSIRPEIRPYFRDTYDHVVQVIDIVEVSREVCADLVDLYMSSMSQRMNEIMKVLTIISTIFIPLSFVAGVYGMNFDPKASRWNMPELNWPFGYPFALAIMFLVATGLLGLFWRWGWFRSERGE